jgi:putative RNA 2'-phosphotransferase
MFRGRRRVVVVASGGTFAVTVSPERLSRLVSHALRHEPWLYELELDDEGWVFLEALLAAIHEQGPQWSQVGRDELTEMVALSAKRRHEIDGERIRALYGHSVPGRIVKIEADPPAQLFHGTSPGAWDMIQHSGLRPMGRQYVHLSVDVATAEQVGRRKSPAPVILTVQAEEAHGAGARFWRGNDLVWLADHVPAGFIAVTTLASGKTQA